jgi:tripartite-type tricarboxylate transporter receptor subunit TctC
MLTRRQFGIGLPAFGLASSVGRAFAEPYPSKPIRYVVPFAAGGATDIVGRLLTDRLSQKFGHKFFLENRGGAGGLTGTRVAVQAPPDGYTLLGMSFNFLLYPKDVVTAAKNDMGSLQFASSGIGTAAHIAGELLNRDAKIKMSHIAYRGGGPANTDVVAGHVAMHFANIGSAIDFIRSGMMRPLAVAMPKRIAALPDVPTMIEEGYPDFVINEFQGVLTAPGTPPELVDRISGEIRGVLAEDETKERFSNMGGEIVSSSPAEFAEFIKKDSEKWTAVARAAGVQAQ